MTKKELEVLLNNTHRTAIVQIELLKALLQWYDQRMSHDYFDPAGIDDVWETVRKYLAE